MPQNLPTFDTRGWPNIKDPSNITEADHAAHRTPRGVTLTPQDMGMQPKAQKLLFKAVKHHFRRPNAPKKRKVEE